MKLTSTFRLAEGNEGGALSRKLLPCTSFKINHFRHMTSNHWPCGSWHCISCFFVMWWLIATSRTFPTWQSHPFCMSVTDVSFISTQTLWFRFGHRQEEDRVTWYCSVQKGYKSRKNSRQCLESKCKITYHWWKSSQIHSVAQCRLPRKGVPPWAGPLPLQRPVMAWQTPHGSSATQPVFF